MSRLSTHFDRRRFLQGAAFTAAAFTTPGLFADALTPRQTEGPFYPNKLPLDTDNDLLIINETTTPAVGTITHLTGRVLSEAGEPIRNAVVEIWQADHNGVYIHTGSANKKNEDKHFQGFGRFLTDSTGQYYFRTIKPVPYVPRTPHIHFAVLRNGHRVLTTQMYIKGEPMNEKDFIYRAVDPKGQEAISVDFKPIDGSSELAANFDIIVGHTPEEPEEGQAAGNPRLRGRVR